MFDSLLSDLDSNWIVEKLTAMLLTNPCVERKNLNPSSNDSTSIVLLDIIRELKGIVFKYLYSKLNGRTQNMGMPPVTLCVS
ncbi:MAG: hypothetical protein D0531_11110 [Methylococcales bacterium]|nr:MAG: hypothetical protein D0531_11110 [Methylococcales bacterium]